jgi:hypothetical protein
MSFNREMDLFFMRNCYFEKDRERVKASAAYRRAEDEGDAMQAQEIATQILERKTLPATP